MSTEKLMRLRPRPGFNSLAWLVWHMPRAEDIGSNIVIAGHPQVCDEGDWLQRMDVLRRDGCTGMTAQEGDEPNERINVDALLAYRTAVGRWSREIIRDLQPEVLDEVIDAALLQSARRGSVRPECRMGASTLGGEGESLHVVVDGTGPFPCYFGRMLRSPWATGLPTI